MNPKLVQIALQLLEAMQKEYEEKKSFSENNLSMLSFLFDNVAVHALDLVDRQCVYHISSPSGREVYQVQRDGREFHICLKNSNFCSCPAYTFHVLRRAQFMCKHKLATLLCTAMGSCKELQYSDETIALMLLGES